MPATYQSYNKIPKEKKNKWKKEKTLEWAEEDNGKSLTGSIWTLGVVTEGPQPTIFLCKASSNNVLGIYNIFIFFLQNHNTTTGSIFINSMYFALEKKILILLQHLCHSRWTATTVWNRLEVKCTYKWTAIWRWNQRTTNSLASSFLRWRGFFFFLFLRSKGDEI